MIVTLVLRLVEERLAEGELAGEAELVRTGERATVRSAGELAEFARAAASPHGAGVPGTAKEER